MLGSGNRGTYRPRLIFWELTTGCNLRCIHCRANATELMSPADLSYSECCEVVDQIAEYAPLILVLSGGEPLWRRDVFDIAKRAVSKNMRVALAPNGTLVDEAMAQRRQQLVDQERARQQVQELKSDAGPTPAGPASSLPAGHQQ